ncbi:uncharacterized protein MYCFIDRAFT_173869 [Pseudocercospora fijiensis CIRAD86]|uniref:Uncharacterized protein n=1 Tax=Pseudocercospora fijiensis (strain CIRAD86) TaxID=383855 RepID=M3B6N0_PSEFD|nr:uncharacterized protein MYCFIDRAFT_173869 [Pseudocercospora fijiensis CIRAD86]EME84998.1 hypothetical protein MYCFIDRAFT_173869 [Pseudocercospora fijiensis CIRAD86]
MCTGVMAGLQLEVVLEQVRETDARPRAESAHFPAQYFLLCSFPSSKLPSGVSIEVMHHFLSSSLGQWAKKQDTSIRACCSN